ncbi:MAG: hypothetical protein ACJ77K_15950 [Bacteroidia bacterium]|jgi:hypothetical protein
MENKIKILGIAFALVTGLAACEKTYVEPEKPVASETKESTDGKDIAVSRLNEEMTDLTASVWHITSFQWHLRKEDNNHFLQYEFVFLKNGAVIAKHDGGEETGKWERRNYFRLAFQSDPLKELNNEKWYFRKETKDRFVLKGISPYDNKSEFVVFERK